MVRSIFPPSLKWLIPKFPIIFPPENLSKNGLGIVTGRFLEKGIHLNQVTGRFFEPNDLLPGRRGQGSHWKFDGKSDGKSRNLMENSEIRWVWMMTSEFRLEAMWCRCTTTSFDSGHGRIFQKGGGCFWADLNWTWNDSPEIRLFRDDSHTNWI
jgi:hypothetical protein